ncbi:DCN1-like protein, partial [Camellia lanceoleosa]
TRKSQPDYSRTTDLPTAVPIHCAFIDFRCNLLILVINLTLLCDVHAYKLPNLEINIAYLFCLKKRAVIDCYRQRVTVCTLSSDCFYFMGNRGDSITNFAQMDDEQFHEMWERLRDRLQQCPHHQGQKSLALDIAIGMWQLLFEEKQWPLVDHWCQFLQARHNKAISRDTWSQLLKFARVRYQPITYMLKADAQMHIHLIASLIASTRTMK